MRLPADGGGREPQTAMRELASGVDALYLSARGVVSPALLAHLEDRRTWAQEVKRAAPCEIGPLTFGIAPHGWGKYRFCLDHTTTRIGITTSRRLPTIRVQPRAQYLHAVGPAAVVDAVHELLAPDFGDLTFSVARVDLFADWQGFTLTAADAQRFVCRADARRTYEHAGALTGFDFGSRSTHTFTARIYDKTAETAGKGTDWWTEVWGDRYVPGHLVMRVEFEVGRQALKEFGLDTPAQVLAAAGDLWAYASGQWLTFRSPTADRTRSRWPVAPEWLAVQRATLAHRSVGVERLRDVHHATTLRRLLPGLTGYLASYAAIVGTDDIDDTVAAVGHHLHDYEITSRTPFAERVERRRAQQAHR